MKNGGRRDSGFTLISLLIVIAIIGILAALAYPGYIDQVRKSRRMDAVSLLMRAANREERYYTMNHGYATTMAGLGLGDETDNGWYRVRITSPRDTDGKYRLVATAQNDQANDSCYKYVIDELGKKAAYGKDSTTDIGGKCW